MRVRSLSIKKFKRFTDLTVLNLPATAKLVVVVGPNGTGKSSLFEAFNVYLWRTKGSSAFDATYHIKLLSPSALLDQAMQEWEQANPTPTNWSAMFSNIRIEFHDRDDFDPNQPNNPRNQRAFYVRSGYRNEADFTMSSLSRMNDMLMDDNRPQFLISPDTRVSANYQRIVASAVAEIFDNTRAAGLTRAQIRDRLIGEVRDAVLRVLPDLELTGVGDPLGDGTFLFRTGAAEGWRYKNLSGGEKAVFDLLLDFIIKRQGFDDTVFCIDEPELHLNTNVQGALLEELYTQIPDACQLWIATHSIGMMRQAKALSSGHPGSVVFLDFGNRDFDGRVVMGPATTDREFWKRTFNVAIGDLAELVAPSAIIFCEGSRQGNKNKGFDAQCFRRIFAAEFPDTEFVSLGSSNEVETNSVLVSSVISEVLAGVRLWKVVDRDDRSPSEVSDLLGNGTRVLNRRHLEAYFFDDEILTKLCQSAGKADKREEVLQAKTESLKNSLANGRPPDDIKSASGPIYVQTKKILGLTGCGNTVEAFCLDTLIPLVTPDTAIYQELRRDVFGLPMAAVAPAASG